MGPGALQRPCAGLDGRAGRQDVVDQQDGLAGDVRLPLRMNVESLTDIAPPFLCLEAGLRTGPASPPQQVRCQMQSASGRRRPNDDTGQQQRLIVAAHEQPPPMERHRGYQVGRWEEIGARPCHPAATGPRDVGPVAMLERQDDPPALIVIDQRGAGPVVTRRTGEAAGAERLGAQILREGSAAAGAVRGGDKGEALPATRAQRSWRADDLVAAKTEWRQHGIEDCPAPPRNCPAHSHRHHAGDWGGQMRPQDGVPLPAAALWPYIPTVTKDLP